MKFALLALFFAVVVSCHPGKSSEESAVTAALANAKDSPSDSTFHALNESVIKLAAAKGYADSATARYILAAAHLTESSGRIQDALGYYKSYLAHYPDRADNADHLNQVIALVGRLQQPELDQILFKSFVHRYPGDARSAGYSEKITAKEITVDSTLKYIGMHMFNDSTFRLNEPMANMYIEGCELAVMADPALPNAPEHLHRAAETARTLRDIPHAIRLYDWIMETYPEHPRAATSLFLKAFTYDNDLKEFDIAGKYYNAFLTKYPNNEFTESAKFLLENLGKSEDELRKMIDANEKNDVQ